MLSQLFLKKDFLLACQDLASVELGPLLGVGGVKAVYLATWQQNHSFALSTLNNPEYKQDFLFGLKMLRFYQNSPLIVDLKGFCLKNNIILTEYHENGNALDFLQKNKLNSFKEKIKFCLDYAKILQTLHQFSHVFCDSNNLEKLLTQLLVTNDLNLILNDVDALADCSQGPIRCGSEPLAGEFLAPEQLHPVNGYDHRSDLWKVPAVCGYFLNGEAIPQTLQHLHSRCKNANPLKRPSAQELVQVYQQILESI